VIVLLILGLRRPVRRLTMAISLWAVIPVSCGWIALSTVVAQRDDGQLKLPSSGHAELPGGGRCDYSM
jgi:hypothetical protein